MSTSPTSISEIVTILRNAKTIAVYGLSHIPGKPAHDIPHFMQRQGFKIIGINPNVPETQGVIPFYGTLDEVPDTIDILNVFRPSADAAHVVDEAIARKKSIGDIATVWLQSGIHTPDGKEKCDASGISYIQDTCIYVIHRYL